MGGVGHLGQDCQFRGGGAHRARRWLPGGYIEMEKRLGLVHLGVMELAPGREAELARSAGVLFNLDEISAHIAAGIVGAGAGGATAHSRVLGYRQGLVLCDTRVCPA